MQPGNFSHGLFGATPSNLSSRVTNPRNNDVSTADTIQEMTRIAQQSAWHPWVQVAIAQALHTYCGEVRTLEEEVRAVWKWIKTHVQFREDEEILQQVWGAGPDKELLIRPERLVSMPQPQGDCDDFSTLAAAMIIGLNAGIQVSFVTVAAEAQEPERFSHVYLQIVYPGEAESVPVDVSHGPVIGWETGQQFRRVEWRVN